MVEIEDCQLKPLILSLDNRLSKTEFLSGSGFSLGVELALHFTGIKNSKYVNDVNALIAAAQAGTYEDVGRYLAGMLSNLAKFEVSETNTGLDITAFL